MGTAIVQAERIGTNPYAPAGANDVCLYDFGDVTGLTLPQLMMAVCIRRAAVIEEQSVLKMNEVNASAAWLQVLAMVGEAILSRSSLTGRLDLSKTDYVPTKVPEQTTYRDFLALEVGLGYDAVPSRLTTSDQRTDLYRQLTDKMSAASTTNQEQVIDLQSLVSRRDSTFNASAATVKRFGTTMNSVASNF